MNCCCENIYEMKIKKGESIGFYSTLTENGSPVDLTDSQMVMEVRGNVVDDGNYVISKTITTTSNPNVEGKIINPAEGQFFFKVNDYDISDMSTAKPYFVAIYHVNGAIRKCISSTNGKIAKFLVFNP